MDGEKSFQQEYPNTTVEAFQQSGEDSFIQPFLVNPSRKATCEAFGPLIIGVDPARFGDDRTAIIRRQARKAFGLQTFIKKDTMEVAGIVHLIIERENPQKVCIDVGGLGAGVYDRLKELGHGDVIVPINSAETPIDQQRFYNKRAEMWGNVKDWLRDTPCEIPDSDELHADLCGPKYKPDSNGRLLIESKEAMKKRGIRSSDAADALGLTFALPQSAFNENKKKRDNAVAQTIAQDFKQVQRLKDIRYGSNRR